MSDSLRPHGLQHARPPCPSPTPRVYSNSCPLSQWCHPTISSSDVPFSSCPQSFPVSRCFPMSQFFASGSQSIGVSVSTSVLPMNIQGWFPLGWTGRISLLSKPNGTHKVLSKIKDLGIPNKVAAAAKSLQSCPTICDPIDRSPPGSSVPGILQARTLECCQNTGNTGLPFPSAMHESEKWKGSHSVVSNS